MATAAPRTELAAFAAEVFANFRQAHGCLRLARQLNARGDACSVGLAVVLMRELSLLRVRPRQPSVIR